MNTKPLLAVFGAILLWSFVAAFSYLLAGVPPLFLTGAALFLGGIFSLPKARLWTWNRRFILAGVIALFSYHFILFLAMRTANPVECNIINYLWPLFLVLLAPLFEKGLGWTFRHLLGGILGFAGAFIAIYNPSDKILSAFHYGYILAFGAAIIWPVYSLYLKRFPLVSSWTMGLVCLITGLVSLAASFTFGEAIEISGKNILYLIIFGLGPMGFSFALWDYALKNADPRKIGTLSYLTPILSTFWLTLASGNELSIMLGLALFLVVVGAVLGRR
ncbi:MAG: EamA family transporter [Planctomycetes bacterium]|nr:EamA family transporter [Planctomycetota bacterium]